MASIRIPKTGKPLLSLCRAANDIGAHCIFDTYAHLLTFATCFGYFLSETQGVRVPDKIDFLKNPNPIEFRIFRTNQLYPQLLTMGLAVSESHIIAINDESLAELVERYASVGFEHMKDKDLAKLMAEAPFDFEKAELQI